MRRLSLLVLATVALTFTGSASARWVKGCGELKPRAELRCAKGALHQARHQLHHPSTAHPRAFWQWRRKVALRWVAQAHRRLGLPLTSDWQTAVRVVQRVWPGTAAWMLSCSAHEGGHGPFVMNYQGSGAGGWLQYLEGTWESHFYSAIAQARSEHRPLPPQRAWSWTSPLGQAFAGGWGYSHQRSAWSGDPWC